MLLFTIVKCCLCFLHLFPMARLRAKSGNSLPPISPGRSAGESNYHKIESFQFLLLQYKWRQGDQPPPGPTQSSQRWWVSPSSRTGGPASTWATRTSSTDPEFSRCLNLKEIGKKIQSFTQVIYGLLVSPTLTFLLSFGFYFFLYKTVVKVRSMFNQHHFHYQDILFISLGSICCWIPAKRVLDKG